MAVLTLDNIHVRSYSHMCILYNIIRTYIHIYIYILANDQATQIHETYLSFPRFGRIVGSGSVGWVTVKGNAGTAAWPALGEQELQLGKATLMIGSDLVVINSVSWIAIEKVTGIGDPCDILVIFFCAAFICCSSVVHPLFYVIPWFPFGSELGLEAEGIGHHGMQDVHGRGLAHFDGCRRWH